MNADKEPRTVAHPPWYPTYTGRAPIPSGEVTATIEERSRRFNAQCGVSGYMSKHGRTGADRHPDRCTCQNETTPHKHYDRPPFVCARCLECKGYTPAIDAPVPPATQAGGVETPEAAAEAAARAMYSMWGLDQCGDDGSAWDDCMKAATVALKAALPALVAQGWTPPGGTEK